MKRKMTVLNPPERERIYVFPSGLRLTYKDVRGWYNAGALGHRLETGDGRKHIVAKGWSAIELDVKDWTF